MRHQPPLDGLRGIAVAAVFLFHQPNRPSLLRGGFLGVDIFFVLSGYLITSLLLADHARGGVDFRHFYARRARRLLPALGVFFALAAIYTIWFIRPDPRRPMLDGGIAILFYVFNWWQVYHATSYPHIYTHMWSLSIEEQFYVVWPFVLAGALWCARGARRTVGWFVVVLIGASVWTMVWRYHQRVVSAYMLTDSRAHSLLVGALLAICIAGRRTRVGIWLDVLAACAVGFIVWALWTASPQDRWLYEGGYLAFACAVAVVILAAQRPGPLRAALSFRPFCWLGLISYGVYLFHIPLDGMTAPRHTGLGIGPTVWLHVVLVGGFATASYLLVERPLRYGRHRVTAMAGVPLELVDDEEVAAPVT